jgi:hypothetical protein
MCNSDHRHRIYRITKGNICDRCDLHFPNVRAHVDNFPSDTATLPIVRNVETWDEP